MDASQDVWDWEVLPDNRNLSMSHGSKNLDDQETEEHDLLPPSEDADVHDECKDIGVVPDETKPVPSVVADLMDSDDGGEEEKKVFQSPDAKEAAANDDSKFAQEEEEEEDIKKDDKFAREDDEEEDIKKDDSNDDKARPPQCLVFSVGKLKVNGIGALCSFGVAAATFCIFLIGGRLQHHHHHRQQEQQKIQLQFYGDDKCIVSMMAPLSEERCLSVCLWCVDLQRIQQVVQQTSRLNQAMSSVMGAGGASTRANISFGGFYDGF